MKRAYKIVFALVCVIVLLSFLPWLYTIVFPTDNSDPFIAYSPVSNSFVVSEPNGDNTAIYTIDAQGQPLATGLTKNDRDSLVPQMYFNQLNARGVLPDSIGDKAIDVPTLKHAQWVFNSLPRDINRATAGVYPIMESRPKRVDLEDPKEVFTLDGEVKFIDMATNEDNNQRSAQFQKVFDSRGFTYPVISSSANITARKAYDEGYLLVDAANKVYHMKMQAGQPYMAAINMPDSVKARHAFILENPDAALIGLVATTDGDLYAVERSGYQPVRLPIDDVDPQRQRITIMKNLFNWVIKISDKDSSRWVAINSDDYSLLGMYSRERPVSAVESVAEWIFPFRITFTDIDDCYAYPRFSDFSLKATLIWLIIALLIYFAPKLKPSTHKL